ncbi:hypothetical protein DIPPA_27777 [Diplonema papillatum]|nr:hypothetical protein DIPPA_27777 [Diplonema papillatum]
MGAGSVGGVPPGGLPPLARLVAAIRGRAGAASSARDSCQVQRLLAGGCPREPGPRLRRSEQSYAQLLLE